MTQEATNSAEDQGSAERYQIKGSDQSYRRDELRAKIASNEISIGTMVRRGDSGDWVVASNLEEFKDLVKPMSPAGWVVAILVGGALLVIAGYGLMSIINPDVGSGHSTTKAELAAMKKKAAASRPKPIVDRALANKRKIFDKKRGNNAEAAATSEGLLKLMTKHAKHFDIFTTLQGDEDGFKRGMSLKAYRSSAAACIMMVVVQPRYWERLPQATQKDLTAKFVLTLKKLYSPCGPRVTVSNGTRTVAEGKWSALSNEPSVTLK